MRTKTKLTSGIGKGVAIIALLLAALGTGFAAKPAGISDRENNGNHLSKELDAIANDASQDGNQLVDVIIQFKSKPGGDEDNAVRSEGGEHRADLQLINGNLYRVPVKALKHLAANPNILYITPDRATTQSSDYTEATVGANVEQSYGFSGAGVGIAVIDSGVASHQDLLDPLTGQSRVVYSESFVSGLDAVDQYGHGTHVAGIIAGNGSASNGNIFGMAPKSSIINLRVLDANGAGTDSQVIAAIQRAIQLKGQYNIRVINLSLGRGVYESYKLDPLCQAVEQAYQAGIVVVAAAGNKGRDNSWGENGYGTISAPANDPYVLTVGAANTNGTPWRSDDKMTSYSSKGPTLIDHIIKPDVVAPGNNVSSLLVKGSTLDTLVPGNEVSPLTYGGSSLDAPQYFNLSGTSMATPVVSGAVALLLQRSPSLTPDQVKADIMKTADKYLQNSVWAYSQKSLPFFVQYDIFTVGAGYLNVLNLMNDYETPSGVALSPTAVKDASGNILLANGSTPSGQSVIWGSSVVWGASVVWGTNTLQSGILSTSTSLLGTTTTVSSNSVIWGSSVVWGTDDSTGAYSVIWGSSVVWGIDGSTTALSAGDGDQ